MATFWVLPFLLLSLQATGSMVQGYCGGNIFLPVDTSVTATIVSPGYPGLHTNNLYCTWKIATNTTSGRNNGTHQYMPRIMFRIVHMDLETNNSGCLDFVLLDNTLRFCGKRNLTNQASFLSKTHITSIVFRSNGRNVGIGFKIKMWTYTDCGGRRIIPRGGRGVIYSPRFSLGVAPFQLNCQWVITAASGKRIRFNLSDHGNRPCREYFLWVVNFKKNLQQHVCANGWQHRNWLSPVANATFVLMLPIRQIKIVPFQMYYFDSGTNVEASRPPANCSVRRYIKPGHTFNVATPNWPANYPHNLRCVIEIYTNRTSTRRTLTGSVTVPNRLYFYAQDFSVEHISGCRYDYLLVDKYRYCGTSLGPVGILTNSYKVTMFFVSDSTNSRPGFNFKVSVINGVCGQLTYRLLHNSIVTIRTPNYPNNYILGANCTWTLIGPASNSTVHSRLYITANKGYDIQASRNCMNDYLRIGSGPRICGTGNQTAWLAPSRTTITFQAFVEARHKGFELTIRVISNCGGSHNITRLNSYGYLKKFYFPGVYPSSNFTCRYEIYNRLAGRGIGLSVYVLSVNSTCKDFSVWMRNAATNEVVQLCGTYTNVGFLRIASNRVTVEVRSHRFHHPPYFSIRYSDISWPVKNTTNASCSDKHISLSYNQSKTIFSPNYPSYYSHSSNCSWYVKTIASHRRESYVYPVYDYAILVRLITYSIEYHSSCKYDYLQINNGSRICGDRKVPRSFLVPNYRTLIYFETDRTISKGGFQATLTSVKACGGYRYITASHYQWLHPPNYPYPYPKNVVCKWYLRTNGIAIQIMPLRPVPDTRSPCRNFYLNVYSPWRSYSMIDLCRGHSSLYWSITISSPAVVTFGMRTINNNSVSMPNLKVRVGIAYHHSTYRPPYHRTTRPPYHRTTRPPYHRTTRPPYHRTTRPPYHRTTRPPYHRTTPPRTGTTVQTRKSDTTYKTTPRSISTSTPGKKPTETPPSNVGTWAAWTPWSPCSATCGPGILRRQRTCAGAGTSAVCLQKGGVRKKNELQTKLCVLEGCPATQQQKNNAIDVTFLTTASISKEVFFKYIFPPTAFAVMTSVNAFCNKVPGRCCRPGDSRSYKKIKAEQLIFVSQSGVRPVPDTPVIDTTLSVKLFLMPDYPNPLCSNIAITKRRKKRAAIKESEPLTKSALAEAAKDIDKKKLALTIRATLRKNLNITADFLVTVGSEEPQKSTNNWKGPVIALSVILLIALAFVAAFFVFRWYRKRPGTFDTLEEESTTDRNYANPVYSNFGVSDTSHA